MTSHTSSADGPAEVASPELLAELSQIRDALASDPQLGPALVAALDRVEQALKQARRAAEGANRARATFLNNMSHELRTPLNAILGFSQLLRQDNRLAPEQRTQVDIIHRSGEQLLAMITDLLDLSRQDDQDGPSATTFNLHQLLEDLEDMLYLRAERRALRLRIARDLVLPRLIRCDGPKLRQILLLLLGNAVRFSRPGDLSLRLTCTPLPEDSMRGRLLCRLNVPGLGPADLAAFLRDRNSGPHRMNTAKTPREEDVPLSRELARALGGAIELVPLNNDEAELQLEIPVGIIVDTAELEDQQIVGLAPDQPPLRILVAEDRWQSRQLLTHTLSRVGFDVQEASNGAEALTIWQRWQPHLIWMDMRMPGITGLEATLRIKRSPAGKDTVIVALTASAFDEDPATARAAGCTDFVRKPIRIQEIFAKLQQHLGVRYVYDTPGQSPAPTPPSVQPQDLASQPPAWIESVHRACIRADLGELLRLIDQARERTPNLANALEPLARAYAYEPILALTRAVASGAKR